MSKFFQSLDSPFVGIDSKPKEPLCWTAKEMTVKQKFQLPIPSLAGSTCKYRFSTKIGDIAFCVQYICPGRAPEVIFETARVPSDQEPITGSYKSSREGTLMFIFDNSFSWFNPKLLTYNIELFQPAFTVADNQRCMKSRSMLYTIVEDTTTAMYKLAKAQQSSHLLRLEIPLLEEKLAQLTAELTGKKAILSTAVEVVKDMSERIAANSEKKDGLCIRCLNKQLLQAVFSFLGPQSAVGLTSKYWLLVVRDSLQQKQASISDA